MLFTLEAMRAKQGDALILHYGPVDDPRYVVIDGGPAGVYDSRLRPRLIQLRENRGLDETQSLALDLVIVSHSDADHITGILDLYDEELTADENHQPLPFKIRRLWHNSFDDLLGHAEDHPTGALPSGTYHHDDAAIVASVGHARRLRQACEKLGTGVVNRGQALLVARGGDEDVTCLGHGLTLRVICPDEQRMEAFRRYWQRELPKILAREKTAAEVAAITDNAPPNLASIVVLAQMGNRTMLLTGDARGDDILAGLEKAGLLTTGGTPLHVDLLKMPHHGSSRNVDEDFFRRILADHYVFSADGTNDNPDPATLQMIADARGHDAYTLHFTFPKDASETETRDKQRIALAAVMNWIHDQHIADCRVVYADASSSTHSVHVDLGDDSLDVAGRSAPG